MSKEVIIREILKRFRLDSNSIRRLQKYEYLLIYQSFSRLSPKVIDEAIEGYKRRDFKVKGVKNSFFR